MKSSLRTVLGIVLGLTILTGYAKGSAPHDRLGHPMASRSLQSSVIKGKISDDGGVGMPGVNVMLKGTTIGGNSDADGNYSINVPADQSNGTLVFSFIGFLTQEVPINGRSTIDVSMQTDIQQLSEVVVVGYGTQDKRDVTASITSISADAISKIATTNTLEGMKGQIAGVDVLQANGRPGSNPGITIRGRRSINASNDPLFVVDGVPMTAGTGSLSDFNPADINSIEVLKDAAATAIYGSRGANGVVLISTKRGKSGKTSVSYSGYYGVTKPFGQFPMMNGAQFADLKREGSRVDLVTGKVARSAWNGNIPADNVVFVDPVELKSVQEGRSTNWQDLIFHNGSQTDHQVSVNGGNEKTQFNMSLGYFNQGGTIDGMDFTKITARVNLDHQISKHFKVGMSNQLTHSLLNNGSGDVLGEAVNQTPLGVPYDDQGNVIFLPIADGQRSNPLSEIIPGKRINEEATNRVFSSIYVEADILKGLKYKFLIGTDMRYRNNGVFSGQYTRPTRTGLPVASYRNRSDQGYTMENLLTYNKVLNEKHNFGFTFLQSIQENTYEDHNTSVTGLPYETQKWYNLGTGAISSMSSRLEHWALASFMGRVNYTFNGKYMVQATLRSDGSSRLAPGHQWTNFPGLSLGWRIIDESFMSNLSFLSDLKLRGSYGVVGNTSIDPYSTNNILARSVYTWDEVNAAGFRLSSILNPNLGWEKSSTVDVGLDFGFLNGKLSGTFDYYETNTTDLLLRRNLPPSGGYDNMLSNIGATRTKGIEFTLNANIIDSPTGFKWDADVNVSHYKEEIVDLAQRDANGNKLSDTGNSWFIGQPIRVFYDYKKTGIWQADEVDVAKSMMGAFPGEIKLQDTDGDGLITPADRVILGNDIPSAYGGVNNRLSYKGIDLSFFVYYRLGYMLDSRFHSNQATMQARYNNLAVDYWTIDNPSNEYPRPNINQENPQNSTTLRYKDGGFVKLRTVTLGYNLPSNIATKFGLSSARIYVSAQNPKVWSSYKVFDPETLNQIDDSDVPTNKLFLGGINLSF